MRQFCPSRICPISLQRLEEYDAATVALRVLRLVAAASILAFGLTARAATTAHAHDAASESATAVVESSATELGEQSQTEPSPVEPSPVEPVPVEPPPVEPPPVDPPVYEEPPPEDPVEPPPADPPPIDPPILEEPPPPIPDTAGEPPPTVDDPAVIDPSPADPLPPRPSDLPSPVSVSPAADGRGSRQATSARTTSRPAAKAVASEPAVPTHSVAPDQASAWAEQPVRAAAGVPQHELMPVAAGIAAGLAVTNRTPVSVAVAIEFGRAGGGWAGAIVFNLWLRRQLRERQMSQRQLAALSGVDHSTISRLLLKDRRPSLATATKLAAALRHVDGEQAEADAADYFERIPAETLFPARRVEMALRADELLDDDEVRHLMMMYLNARRKRQLTAAAGGHSSNGRPSPMSRSTSTRAGPPTRAAPTRGDT